MYSLLILFVDLLCIGYSVYFIREMLVGQRIPPYIRTRTQVAAEIAEIIGSLHEGSMLYDLGCGDARVLRACADRNPHARFIGIELRILPYLLALFKSRSYSNISIKRGSFFDMTLHNASHVYTYLYPEVMDRLLPKLQQELKPGTKLYSLDFAFTKKAVIAEHPLMTRAPGKLGWSVFLYEF